MGLVSGIGSALGGRAEGKAYKKAGAMFKQLGVEAGKTRDMIDPWGQYRGDYASQLNKILSGEQDWQTDPGYQFRQQESQRAIERSAMAKGYGMSGNMAAALQQRSQDIASAEINIIIQRLIGLSGATPENAIAGGQAYGNMMSQSISGQAQAQIGQGAAKSRMIGGIFSGLESAATMGMTRGLTGGLSSFFGGGGSTGGAGGINFGDSLQQFYRIGG